MKKKIYFVQPNSLIGKSIYYPYAAGVILSYAFQFEDIEKSYEIGGIIYKEDDINDIDKSIVKPYLIAFSNYFWNYQYNLKTAHYIKEKYPDCIILFGGHQVARNTDFLLNYDFIDMLSFGEGELPFLRILRALEQKSDLSAIPNIAYRNGSEIVKTIDKCDGIKNYPSPYMTGIFDYLLNVNDTFEFNAQLETNRGCPYHCSFCDWCDYDLPMRLFPIERVKADIKWISEHKISYCMCVDSNFGLYERDEEITQYITDLKQKNGYPEKMGASFAKNKNDRIFRINKTLNDAGMSKGVSLAFQSMSEEVLKNISRVNMNNDELAKQLELYHIAGIPTYTELILGLPGETLESFEKGICKLLEKGQHDSINVFRCEVYPNSTLAEKSYIEKYKIKTAVNRLNLNHCLIDNATFSGGLEFITETSSMSFDEMVKSALFSYCIQSLHCHGLLQFVSIFVHDYCRISYYDIYRDLIESFIEKNGLIGTTLKKIKDCIINDSLGKIDLSFINPVFGDITWPYEEIILLDFIYQKDVFYFEAKEYFKKYHIPTSVYEDLFKYQENIIATPGSNEDTVKLKYNWKKYFENSILNNFTSLEVYEKKLTFITQHKTTSWENFAKEIIWFGRRNKRTIRLTEVKYE